MLDREKVIEGLKFTKAMITFNPLTGEDIDPEDLNEEDKISYDACVGAIALLKEQEAVVRCKDCAYALFKEGVQHGHIVCTKPFTEHWQAVKPSDWFCADGKPKA